jgi:hypothetical protein
MAAKQAKSVASLKPFDFEGDINDSDYVLVKRVEVRIDPRLWWDYNQTAETELQLQPFMVREENIKPLSNTEFLLQIQVKQVEIRDKFRLSVLEFNLNNMTKSNGLHFEISLNVEFSGYPGRSDMFINGRPIKLQDFDLNLTQNFGTTFMSKPFYDFKFCDFKLVLKLPHDSMMDTTMSKLFTEAGEFCSDIKIICDDQTFQCHKIILAMQSDVFKAQCIFWPIFVRLKQVCSLNRPATVV